MQSWQLRQSKYAHIVIDASPIWSHVTIIFGHATLSAHPLLSIAYTSLSQRLSSNNNDFENATSQIEVDDDVLDNNTDNSSGNADVNETSAISFIPSDTKQISINTIDVMLHLLLKHKANLLLYDEICNLFNNYLDPPNFDRSARDSTKCNMWLILYETYKLQWITLIL